MSYIGCLSCGHSRRESEGECSWCGIGEFGEMECRSGFLSITSRIIADSDWFQCLAGRQRYHGPVFLRRPWADLDTWGIIERFDRRPFEQGWFYDFLCFAYASEERGGWFRSKALWVLLTLYSDVIQISFPPQVVNTNSTSRTSKL